MPKKCSKNCRYLLLTYFRPMKSCFALFRSEAIVSSFFYLIVFIFKMFKIPIYGASCYLLFSHLCAERHITISDKHFNPFFVNLFIWFIYCINHIPVDRIIYIPSLNTFTCAIFFLYNQTSNFPTFIITTNHRVLIMVFVMYAFIV